MLRAADTVAQTDTGRQRRDNEDSAYARAPVFVVADGMGGAQAGEVASHIAVEVFEQGVPEGGSPEERLADRAREANKRIHDLSKTQQERAGMGTTLTAAYLDDSELAIAHVGDSRAYLFRDGELKMLTQDHSLVAELVQRGKLTEEQAAEHPQRSIITRALGPEPTVEVDTVTYPVRAGDVLLLCSDGLTSMISDDQIAAVLATTPDLHAAAAGLIEEANAAGGRDNITVVLFRLEEAIPGAEDQQPADHPTMIAAPAVEGDPSAVVPVAPRPEPAVAEPTTKTTRAPRLARTQGRRRAGKGPRRRNWRERSAKPAAAIITVVLIVFLVGGGGYLATRQLFFIGTNSQGIVTVYRGLPYNLPFGLKLYESFYVSGVPGSLVPPDRRKAFFNDDLVSQTTADRLVHDLELGKVSQ
jgi:serine/threonine protein phosphatase PrpC